MWRSAPDTHFVFIGPSSPESEDWFVNQDARIHYLGKVSDQEKADAVYDGLTPVTPDEVADCVMFALTRPLHVNLDEIVIKAIAQSSGSHVVRKTA